MNNTHEIGHQGEAISLHFLAFKKHHISDRNWRWQILNRYNSIR